MLLTSTDIDVTAITVSGTGEVRCPAGVDVARGLLELTDRTDVPVACGRSTPLSGDHAFPDGWRDAADGGWGLDLPSVAGPSDEGTAVELLRDVLAAPNMTVLTLGPATNLAEVFRADSTLAGRLSSIVMMGGAVDVPGNVALDAAGPLPAEWNFYIDPVAAAEVIASGAPVTLVGLDATDQVPVSGDVVELLAANAQTEAAKLVHQALLNNPRVYEGGAFFWDPFAAGVLLDPTLATTEQTPIEVVTADGPETGRTVRATAGPAVAVAVGADAEGFATLLIRTLAALPTGESPATLAPPAADVLVQLRSGECTFSGPTEVGAGAVRFTFESDEAGWFGAVAATTSELTDQQIVELVKVKGSASAAELGVVTPTLLFAVGGTRLTDVDTRLIVFCGNDNGDVGVAGTISPVH